MMFERLDARRLFATLAGTIFQDADNSDTFDVGEAPLRDATVYIDANANGRFDAGERSLVTNKTGVYTFKDVEAGSYLIGVVTSQSGFGQTTPGADSAVTNGFDIELVGLSGLSASTRRAFQQAAERWESIITTDLPNVGQVDDVRINVAVERIDGAYDTLAEAGPTRLRLGSQLPYTGELILDSSDVSRLSAAGHLVDTIAHEMAHVLGFGTIWSDLDLVADSGSSNPTFRGKTAVAEYNRLFNKRALGVPVESEGGDGTAEGHWAENVFSTELLTGYSEAAGIAEPLSRVTVASLADIGYTVNLSAADTWDPIRGTDKPTTPLDLGGRSFLRRVNVGKRDSITGLDFGFREDTAPVVGSFTVRQATLGEDAQLLTATDITDPEDDDIFGVSFYRESNGRRGLQGGRGGDAYLGAGEFSDAFGWLLASKAWDDLTGGEYTYYAVATDRLGLSGRISAAGEWLTPPPPVRPNPVIATRIDRRSARLDWKDRADYEIGFRVELLTDDGKVAKAFNVPADSRSAQLTELARGTFYTARVRSFGYGGASAYTRTERFRV